MPMEISSVILNFSNIPSETVSFAISGSAFSIKGKRRVRFLSASCNSHENGTTLFKNIFPALSENPILIGTFAKKTSNALLIDL